MTGIASVPGVLVFQLKRRPPDYVPRKTKKHPDGRPAKGKERADGAGYGSALPPEKLPYLVELSPGEAQRTVHFVKESFFCLTACFSPFIFLKNNPHKMTFTLKKHTNLKVLRYVLFMHKNKVHVVVLKTKKLK